jgi:phosphatidate cytidylyltransferase
MHFKRWLTAIVALPILIYLVGFGPRWIFYLVLFLFSLAGLNEFYRLTLPDMPMFLKYRGYVLVLMGIISLFVIIPMLYFLFLAPSKGEKYLSEIGILATGLIYVCLPIVMFIQIDRLYLIQHPVRGIWIFFLLVVTFANDTGAFYSGRLFGKHKLYESVSPKKTWEGSVGGVLFAYIAAFAFLKIFRLHQVDLSIILLIFLLSVAGQVGDLAESMLKRNYNVKDSGVLLPGHGGVLDRIDSLLFAAPVLYVFLMISI